jgi:predicted nuclease of restriction endonuclease-like (RecB) superfamily
VFDFLTVGAEANEREIEAALVQHITRFLLELGAGFAFVGRQVQLEVGGEDFGRPTWPVGTAGQGGDSW